MDSIQISRKWEFAMQKQHSGFNLIELIIVVGILGILGILAAVAIPSYQGFVAKTQVSRAVSELGAYRTAYEASLSNNEAINNASLDYMPSQLTTGDTATEIATANPDGSGHLEVTMGGNAQAGLAGLIIRFERDATGEWSCIIDTSATSGWQAGYTPAACTAS